MRTGKIQTTFQRLSQLQIIVIAVCIALGGVLSIAVRQHIAHAAAPCPCHLYTDTETADSAGYTTGNDAPIEVGTQITPAENGYIQGVRFYKTAAMTGTYTGDLWTSSGSLLASGTFSNTTASGWQDLTFTTPVAVTAATTYVVALYVPGGTPYIGTAGYLGSAKTNYPLSSPANAGRYSYGGDVFPTNTTNYGYWVDADFVQTIDGQAPHVSSVTPANGSSGALPGLAATATFDQALDDATVSPANVTMADANNQSISAAVSYDKTSKTITVAPSSALQANSAYTVAIRGGSSGVKNLDGTPMAADYQWTFTTGTDSCPCSVWNNAAPTHNPLTHVGSGGEVFGQTIHADENGYIHAVRFYKSIRATDTTHAVHVWSTSGTLLGSGTSTHETSAGWQEVRLDSPVAVTKGTKYVITFYAADTTHTYSTGVLSAEVGDGLVHLDANGARFINGSGDVFPTDTSDDTTSYWMDAVFSPYASYQAPFMVAEGNPANGAYGVKSSDPLTFRLSQPADPASLSGAVAVKTSAGQSVAGSLSLSDGDYLLTFTPSQALAANAAYSVQLAPSLKDTAGSALGAYSSSFTTGIAVNANINQGLGGPVLVLTSAANPYDTYLAEILRTEGINYFTVKDVSQISASTLSMYRLVLLGKSPLTVSQVSTLTAWVQEGGDLIAMQPDRQLASLLGLADKNQSVAEGYLKVDTTTTPGKGITADTMQYHDSADVYDAQSGTQTVATLYDDATTPRSNPAVSLRTVGHGHAGAFAYDLPKSIALTHQGNPAWAAQIRNTQPIRPDSMFYGMGGTDWLNLNKASIPQADEQQRLLVNMMLEMDQQRTPLPRFWILPHGYKAAVVMTEDDHGTPMGTIDSFDRLYNHSATNCSVVDWQCERGGSLMYTSANLTDAEASTARLLGFAMGLHASTNCADFTSYSGLDSSYASDLAAFRSQYPSLPNQLMDRTHCYVWSDWDSVIKEDAARGMRINFNYEFYPSSWVGSHTGYLTGSGLSMRFTDSSGALTNVYQGVTDLTYETDTTVATMNADLDNAVNANEFYGVFGTHYDYGDNGDYNSKLMAAAEAHNVPLISGDQLVRWKDALDSSTFANITSTDSKLTFEVKVADGGEGMQAMIPLSSGNGNLATLVNGTAQVNYAVSTVKGVQYAVFDARPGQYTAQYGITAPGGGGPTVAPGEQAAASGKAASPHYVSIAQPSRFATSTGNPASGNTAARTGVPALVGGLHEAVASPHHAHLSRVVSYVACGLVLVTGGTIGFRFFRRSRLQ